MIKHVSLKELLNWKHYLSSFYEQVNTRKETGKCLGLRLYAPSKLDASFFLKQISKLFAVWRLLMNCSGLLQRSFKRVKQNLNQISSYKRKRIPRHFQKLLRSMHHTFFLHAVFSHEKSGSVTIILIVMRFCDQIDLGQSYRCITNKITFHSVYCWLAYGSLTERISLIL